jgi:metallo-beta-lactamase class B
MTAVLGKMALAASCAAVLSVSTAFAQAQLKPAAEHRAAARTAGAEHPGLLAALCPEPRPDAAARGRGRGAAPTTPAAAPGRQAAATPRPTPPREQWYAEPVKVFDNLYWLGQTEYSVWAVTTSAGIIIIDTIFDYSVEEEVVGGLKKLGLNPADIKYVVVSHGHGDHSGGARLLQERFKPRVLLSAADWDLLDKSSGTKPTRDMIVTDGQKLTLGDTTLTMYITPGHTAGTISMLIPVKDGAASHVAATWGGTLIGGLRSPEGFQTYIDSAERFRGIVAQAGATIILSNHTNYDGSKVKLPAVQKRQAGQPHPYVIGKEGVQRYLTVASECTKAAYADFVAESKR